MAFYQEGERGRIQLPSKLLVICGYDFQVKSQNLS